MEKFVHVKIHKLNDGQLKGVINDYFLSDPLPTPQKMLPGVMARIEMGAGLNWHKITWNRITLLEDPTKEWLTNPCVTKQNNLIIILGLNIWFLKIPISLILFDLIWKKKIGSNCVVKDFPLKSSKNQFWNFSQVLKIISGSLFINFFLEFIAIS